jgi:nitrous oxide reductase accessory protein NosL
MKYLKIIIAFSILLLAACSSEPSRPVAAPTPAGQKVQSHGRVNQVLVIADTTLWQGPVGDSFFYYFSAPYILLPQPEPIFDVVQMTPKQLALQPLKKEFRTIIFLADMNDENSATARFIRNDLGPEKLVEIQN